MSANQTRIISMAMQMGMEKSGYVIGKTKDGKGNIYRREAVPCLLVGPPGVAKTDILKHIARMIEEKINKPFPIETYAAPQLNAEDLAGLPVPNREDKTTDLYPLRIGKSLIEHGRGVAFIDELSSGTGPVGASCLTFLQNGIIGQTKLDPAVARMAAMNPAEIAAAGRELTAPESNRFLWIQWTLEASDWVDWMRGGEGAAKHIQMLPNQWEADFFDEASKLVTMYISRHQSALLDVPEPHDASKPWASPRSWFNATRFLAACFAVGEGVKTELAMEAMGGCVGPETASQFLNWVQQLDLPDPEAILANPHNVKLPDRADKLSVVTESLVLAATKEHPKRKERAQVAYKILEALFEDRADMAIPAIQTMIKRLPNRAERPAINVLAIKTALTGMGIKMD